MRKVLVPFLSLVFPFILTLLPILGLYFEAAQRRDFELEQKSLIWNQKATGLIQRIRSRCSLDSQIDQMANRLIQNLAKFTELDQDKMCRILISYYQKIFPAFYRPPGTLFYAFSREPSGKLKILKGEGLPKHSPGAPLHVGFAQENGKIMGDLFEKLMNPGQVANEERARLNKRIAGLFGENLDFDMLSFHRRGRLTPGLFRNNESMLFWNTFSINRKVSGVLFLVFPFENRSRTEYLAHSLAIGGIQDQIPVLISRGGTGGDFRIVLPERRKISSELARSIQKLVRDKTFQDEFPLGRISSFLKGFWIQRDLLIPELPYEILIVGRIPRVKGGNSETLLRLALAVSSCLWAFVLFRTAVTGKPPGVTMRFRMMSYFIFLAVVALSSLYFCGSYYIETAAVRKIQDQIQSAGDNLEKVDEGVSSVQQNHTASFREHIFDHEWCRKMLTCSENEGKSETARIRGELKEQVPPIYLSNLLVFRFGKILEQKAFSREDVSIGATKVFLDYFGMMVWEAAKRFQPDLASKTSSPFEDSSRASSLGRLLRTTMGSQPYWDFMSFRQRADLMKNETDLYLIFYDFIDGGSGFDGAILFLADIFEPYNMYLSQKLAFLSAKFDNCHWAFGTLSSLGFEPVLPRSENFWNRAVGKKLRSVMELAGHTKTKQLVQYSDMAFLSLPCRKAKGFVVGGIVSFSQILQTASIQRNLLLTLLSVLFWFMVTLGYFTADWLIFPLFRVEQGLKLATTGDLSVKLGLNRRDELGDLSSAFDEMIQGVRERRELGLFVSSHLDKTIAREGIQRSLVTGKRNATVLVSDLRNFTSLSEEFPPREIVAMLNAHHQSMAEAVEAFGGFVELFIGDAIVAAFFEEEPGKGAKKALDAAMTMMERHKSIQAERLKNGKFTYEIGIGLDWGEVITGTLGKSGRLEYAILGHPRLRAESLEALSKKARISKVIASPLVAKFCIEYNTIPLENEDALEILGRKDA